MKNILKFALGMAGAVSLAPLAHATVLLQHTADTIDASAPTQMGRIPNIVELDHNPQSWDPKKDGSLGETTYPGVIDTTTAFHYNA